MYFRLTILLTGKYQHVNKNIAHIFNTTAFFDGNQMKLVCNEKINFIKHDNISTFPVLELNWIELIIYCPHKYGNLLSTSITMWQYKIIRTLFHTLYITRSYRHYLIYIIHITWIHTLCHTHMECIQYIIHWYYCGGPFISN